MSTCDEAAQRVAQVSAREARAVAPDDDDALARRVRMPRRTRGGSGRPGRPRLGSALRTRGRASRARRRGNAASVRTSTRASPVAATASARRSVWRTMRSCSASASSAESGGVRRVFTSPRRGKRVRMQIRLPRPDRVTGAGRFNSNRPRPCRRSSAERRRYVASRERRAASPRRQLARSSASSFGERARSLGRVPCPRPD